jgi:hypothetical protein
MGLTNEERKLVVQYRVEKDIKPYVEKAENFIKTIEHLINENS